MKTYHTAYLVPVVVALALLVAGCQPGDEPRLGTVGRAPEPLVLEGFDPPSPGSERDQQAGPPAPNRTASQEFSMRLRYRLQDETGQWQDLNTARLDFSSGYAIEVGPDNAAGGLYRMRDAAFLDEQGGWVSTRAVAAWAEQGADDVLTDPAFAASEVAAFVRAAIEQPLKLEEMPDGGFIAYNDAFEFRVSPYGAGDPTTAPATRPATWPSEPIPVTPAMADAFATVYAAGQARQALQAGAIAYYFAPAQVVAMLGERDLLPGMMLVTTRADGRPRTLEITAEVIPFVEESRDRIARAVLSLND